MEICHVFLLLRINVRVLSHNRPPEGGIVSLKLQKKLHGLEKASSAEAAGGRRTICQSLRRLTHLYWMVSDVVEALSLVMRILTMLKRKTKFIWKKATTTTTKKTIISETFVMALCTYTHISRCGHINNEWEEKRHKPKLPPVLTGRRLISTRI